MAILDGMLYGLILAIILMVITSITREIKQKSISIEKKKSIEAWLKNERKKDLIRGGL